MSRKLIDQTVRVSFLLMLACWVALPKAYVHSWLGHDHGATPALHELAYQSQQPDDCDFEKYDKPLVYCGVHLSVTGEQSDYAISRFVSRDRSVFLKPLGLAHCLRGPPACC